MGPERLLQPKAERRRRGCDGLYRGWKRVQRVSSQQAYKSRDPQVELMSKFIPVSSCAYVHSDDVDPEKHINAGPMNDAMDLAVARAVAALENPAGAYTDFQRANMATVLKSMQSSHRSIRKMLGWGEEDPRSVDALAVARVPLEGLYTICLFTESPDWVDVYLRDGWRKQYEHFLLQREETKGLPRFDDFSKNIGPKNLNAHRKILGITDTQVFTVEHEELGTPMPVGVAKQSIPKFPTPGSVVTTLANGTDKRSMLERLYFEYSFLCSFAHGLPDALLFKMMFDKDSKFRKFWDEAELKDTFRRSVAERAYTTSLISIVQSASELAPLYPANLDLVAAVVKAWQEMSEGSLLGNAIWRLRTKKLLGALG